MYLGLIRSDGSEPPKSAGYHRISILTHYFGVGPPRDDTEAFVFFNLTTIKFPRTKAAWGTISSIRLFVEADDRLSCYSLDCPVAKYIAGHIDVHFAPRALEFGVYRLDCDIRKQS